MKNIDDFVNRILCGNCVDVMKEMPSNSVDFVLTDPPYLVNYRSSDGRSISNDAPHDSSWLTPSFAEAYRVLANDRFFVSFYGWSKADAFIHAWKSAGFRIVEHFVWVKNYYSSEGFVRRYHEQAYLLAKGRPRKPRIVLSDVLRWKYSGDELHPTQKPVMALLPLIMAYSDLDDIVLDPFAGSATTAIAALALGRRYIGIEILPTYARAAEERLKHERGE